MNDRLLVATTGETPAAPGTWQWAEDPAQQLKELAAELTRQSQRPEPATRAFVMATERALQQLPEHCEPALRSQALCEIAAFHYLDAHPENAIRPAREAAQLASVARDAPLEARARMLHGTFLSECYDWSGGLAELEVALQIARRRKDSVREARVLNALGNWHLNAGLLVEAKAFFLHAAESAARTVVDEETRQLALGNVALMQLYLAEVEDGVKVVRQVLCQKSPADASINRLHRVQWLLTLGRMLLERGEVVEVARLAQEALETAGASGSAQAGTLASCLAAIAAVSAGEPDDGMQRVIDRARRESPSMFRLVLTAAIRTYERVGQTDAALVLQYELLALNRREKFEKVRHLIGRSTPEEALETSRLGSLQVGFEKTVDGLVSAAVGESVRAGYDRERVFRVAGMAERFALAEGWSAERATALGLAAKLIDIGTAAISTELLQKSRGLSAAERKIVAEHAQFGADILASASLQVLQACIPAVRFHHERWDGSGPCAMAGDGIPIEARMVALCDCFDALTHDRPWRKRYSAQAGLRILSEEAGTRFEPALAGRFVAWVQAVFWQADDFDAAMAVDAAHNDYLRLLTRIDRLRASDKAGA